MMLLELNPVEISDTGADVTRSTSWINRIVSSDRHLGFRVSICENPQNEMLADSPFRSSITSEVSLDDSVNLPAVGSPLTARTASSPSEQKIKR